MICDGCAGTGTCSYCHGTGGPATADEACEICEGTGTCCECAGTGQLPNTLEALLAQPLNNVERLRAGLPLAH